MEATKLVLEVLFTRLNAAPIPNPFKSAVTAIPNLALNIFEVVGASRYLRSSHDTIPDQAYRIARQKSRSQKACGGLQGVRAFDDRLAMTWYRTASSKQGTDEDSRRERILTDRKLLKRAFSYTRDALKLANMTKRLGDAVSQFQQQYDLSQQQCLVIQKQEVHRPSISWVKLGVGDSRAVNKDPCLKRTRIAPLDNIMQWIWDPSGAGKGFLCLHGLTGSEKSAIAASIAKQARSSQQLGVQFHFTRNEQDRNKGTILVIARQLASWGGRKLRLDIAVAIESEPEIAWLTQGDQFRKLIQEPLESLEGTSPALVIVLDTFDECGGD
ncbi:F-box/WD repeat-containing protein 9 [Tulasnella sp. 332]|nr:F-box/WD repeat-containing protein 9 [Tulasnella sp. 332]